MNKLLSLPFYLTHILVIFLVFIVEQSNCYSNTNQTDSILRIINTSISDSERCIHYSNLCLTNTDIEPVLAIEYGIKALQIAKKLKNKKLLVTASRPLSFPYLNIGNYNKASKIASVLINYAEKENDSLTLVDQLNVLANINLNTGRSYEAKNYFYKALAFLPYSTNKSIYATLLNNIAISYEYLNKLDSAILLYEEALQIHLQSGNIEDIVLLKVNILELYLDQNNFRSAQKYISTLTEDLSKIKNNGVIALGHLCIAMFYEKTKNNSLAKKHYLISIEVSEKNSLQSMLISSYQKFSTFLENSKNEKESLLFLKKYLSIRDSVYNNELKNSVNVTEMKLLENRKENELLLQKAEITKQDITIKNQNLQKTLFAFGFIFMILLGFFLYRNLQLSKQSKKITEIQKKLLEDRNREITDSINYATRIQTALLPPNKLINQYFNDYFILYKPKDIVAGDFYWVEKTENSILFAVADCTGHGVPGAMVSVVCTNALNRSVREYGLTIPGEILDKTRQIVIQEFEKSDDDVKDGMDISLCSINNNKLYFSGANNPLWIYRNKQLIEIPANKQPIGKFDKEDFFNTHYFELEKNDSIYLFSDGYCDQFGGEKGKKFKTTGLKKTLLSIQDKTMFQQKEILNQTFEKWKDQLEQVDDVCILAIKF